MSNKEKSNFCHTTMHNLAITAYNMCTRQEFSLPVIMFVQMYSSISFSSNKRGELLVVVYSILYDLSSQTFLQMSQWHNKLQVDIQNKYENVNGYNNPLFKKKLKMDSSGHQLGPSSCLKQRMTILYNMDMLNRLL